MGRRRGGRGRRRNRCSGDDDAAEINNNNKTTRKLNDTTTVLDDDDDNNNNTKNNNNNDNNNNDDNNNKTDHDGNNNNQQKNVPRFLDMFFWPDETDVDTTTKSSSSLLPRPLTIEDFEPNNNTDTKNNDDDSNPATEIQQEQLRVPVQEELVSTWKMICHYKAKKKKKNHQHQWSNPTPIQLHAWPILLLHFSFFSSSLIQIAPTGSGKTLSYGIPACLKLQQQQQQQEQQEKSSNSTTGSSNSSSRSPTVLILVPTRELVLQVQRELQLVIKAIHKNQKKNTNHSTTTTATTTTTIRTTNIVACYGGVDKQAQQDAILQSDNNDDDGKNNNNNKDETKNNNNNNNNNNTPQVTNNLIVVATPGRLLDLVTAPQNKESKDNNNKDNLSSLSLSLTTTIHQKIATRIFSNLIMIVLDEADRLAMQADLAEQTTQLLHLATHNHNNNHNEKKKDHVQQMVLCSATWPDKVSDQWKTWIFLPAAVASSTKSTTTKNKCIVVKVNTISIPKDKRDENQKDKTTNNATDAAVMVKTSEGNSENEDTQEVGSEKKVKSDFFSKIPSNLEQIVHVCAEHKKPRKLVNTLKLIRTTKINQDQKTNRKQQLGIVFCSKIKTVQYITKFLQKENFKCSELHGNLKQSLREKIVKDFTCGKISLVIATDIAARGIHVGHIQFVINYDFPTNLEQYIHRCGRAGRNGIGDPAKVYSFFTRNLAPLAHDLVILLQTTNQWIDPNLQALILPSVSKNHNNNNNNNSISSNAEEPPYKKQKHEQAIESNKNDDDDMDNDNNNEEEEESDDDFKELSAQRIVLQRASNVSDASSSSSEDENENQSDDDNDD